MPKNSQEAHPLEDILFLAIELEALNVAGDTAYSADAQILRAVDRHGAPPAIAGILLARFARGGPVQSSRLWLEMPLRIRDELARTMLAIYPQVTVLALGAANLCDLLRDSTDSWLHDRIANALAGGVVQDSHLCLPVMLPAAKDRLAVALAERAGSSPTAPPEWIAQLPTRSRRLATGALAFGMLSGGREAQFASIVRDFDADDWKRLHKRIQNKAGELNASGVALFLRHRPEAISPADSGENRAICRGKDQLRDGEHQASFAHLNIVQLIETATASDLTTIFSYPFHTLKPTWRREAYRALLRRALSLGVRIPGKLDELPRAEFAAEIAVFRLAGGDTSVLRRSSWQHIEFARRFTLLMRSIAAIGAGTIEPTIVRLAELGEAILSMPPATRDILANQFIMELGSSEAMSDAILDRFANATGCREDTLVVLARARALRGERSRSQDMMRLAEQVSSRKLRGDGLRRLCEVLDDRSIVSLEPVSIVSSSLTTVADEDLPNALRACHQRLTTTEYELVIAGLIARGRATNAFAGSVG